ncbi:MAG: hypothetical protein LBG65_04365 [Puniceicoccales bacterium]|jgi:hypothetical protein|nr:hypothetical protein [Puniceicoccales bacterium]
MKPACKQPEKRPRKPRSDSVLKNLPLEKRQRIEGWFLADGLSQQEVRERIAAELQLDVGKTAVSEYYRDEVWPVRYQRSVASAETVRDLLAATPGTFDEAAVRAIQQKVFDLSLDPEAATGDIATLAKVLAEARAARLKEDELALRRRESDLRESQFSEMLRIKTQELTLKVEKAEREKAAILQKLAEIEKMAEGGRLTGDQIRARIKEVYGA